jgi:hypothetical protein
MLDGYAFFVPSAPRSRFNGVLPDRLLTYGKCEGTLDKGYLGITTDHPELPLLLTHKVCRNHPLEVRLLPA